MGIRRGGGLAFDHELSLKDEYDISLMNAFRHRYCFKDMRFNFENDTTMRVGGLAGARNSVTMAESVTKLQKKYGTDVVVLPEGKNFADGIAYNVQINLPM
jgi:hypothetical protein